MNFINDCQAIIVAEFNNYDDNKYIFKESSLIENVNLYTLVRMYFDAYGTGEFIINLRVDSQIILEASFDIGVPVPEAFQDEIRSILKFTLLKLKNLQRY